MKEKGVLMPIFSIPSKYGIGDFGPNAKKFVDFLVETKDTIWQILPIGVTSIGDSPYQPNSLYAINPYFISLDYLVKDKLLKREEILPYKGDRIDYGWLYNTRYQTLELAFERFNKEKKDYKDFKAKQKWLDEYATFMALKKIQNNKPFNEWILEFKFRNEESLEWFKKDYSDSIEFYKFIQYYAYKHYNSLKRYANNRGIKIMGDLPIYSAYDSADVWSNSKYYQLDENLNPTSVAGCPPDAFSDLGQLWGNPLYNWDKIKEDKYKFFLDRIESALSLYDIVRLDHFRGFEAYYSIPYGRTDARVGEWIKGPGYRLFNLINKKFNNPNIVAENLGYLTKEVFDLLKKTNYPGMNIFQFELGDLKHSPLLKPYKENNVLYSGTHDNRTIISFYNDLSKNEKHFVDKLCNIGFMDKPNLKIIEFLMKEPSKYVIIPYQDYLGYSDEKARINSPSTFGGNWNVMFKKEDFSKEAKEYMKNLVR